MPDWKAQSAMEYLMTYGWAILIIAVVLGALFGLGFFNSANLAPKVSAGACQVYRPQGPGTTSFINLEGTCNNELPQYVGYFNDTVGRGNYCCGLVLPQITFGNTATTSNAFTISAWAYATREAAVGGNCALLGFHTNSGLGYELLTNVPSQGSLRMTGRVDTTVQANQYPAFSPSMAANAWSFVTLSVSQSNKETIYIDAVGGSAGEISGNVPATTSQNFIGTENFYTGCGWIGYISDVQIYNASLSPNEILALYQEGIGGVPVLPQSLVGWWPLNGNGNDYSGNMNNANTVSNVLFTGSWTNGYTAP